LLLVIDLWALTRPLVQVRDPDEVYAPSPSLAYLVSHNPRLHRTLDRNLPGTAVPSPLGTGVPLARIHGIPAARGYNPLDVLRYKEYLQLISGEDGELKPFKSVYTFPVIGDFPVKNRGLLDLLGVRYLLQPTEQPASRPDEDQAPPGNNEGWQQRVVDPRPLAFDLERGLIRLPPYTVYENLRVYPRAFVVPHAEPLPERPRLLPALARADFRWTVFLEDMSPAAGGALPLGSPRGADPNAVVNRRVTIRGHQPNRVVLHVEDGPAGVLVWTEAYYPGWSCESDGRPQRLFRADYLFQAVEVGEGEQTLTFCFYPESYRRGRRVTWISLVLAFLVLIVTALHRLVARPRSVSQTTPKT
jgi:hypothetical protein